MSSQAEFIYVIPPYLLNSTLGHNLKQQLLSKDEKIGNSNVLSYNSSKYCNSNDDRQRDRKGFSQDSRTDQILKQKLIYKFSVLGILGNPVDSDISDERLYGLWLIFRDRIVSEKNKGLAPSSKEDAAMVSKLRETAGEAFFSNEFDSIPDSYLPQLDSYLRNLLLETKRVESNIYSIPRRLIKFDDGTTFDYPLPSSWAPLMKSEDLSHLKQLYKYDINNDKGSPTIAIEPQESPSKVLSSSAKWCNYITDKPVPPATGIFYYELTVKQEASQDTDFQPLIVCEDSAMSSENSLHFAMGFIKQNLMLDPRSNVTPSSVTNYATAEGRIYIDLESVKRDVYCFDDVDISLDVDENIDQFLSLKAGDMKGSYVINFESSDFQNSIHAMESRQRSAVYNMNRRLSQLGRQTNEELSNGNVDLDVPFNTYITQGKSKKLYKTDVVGCGINFIDKSIFITLNGILIKVIPRECIQSRISPYGNLFDDNADNAVYPLIGFELLKLKEKPQTPQGCKSEVIANFGAKEFKFNINNYVKDYKAQTQQQLYMSELKKVQSLEPFTGSLIQDGLPKSISELLSSMNEDPAILNEFIRSYLDHEGYLKTHEAFERDLNVLNTEINSGDSKSDTQSSSETISQHATHSHERQMLKSLLFRNQFDQLLSVLENNYSNMLNSNVLRHLLFEVKYLKYIHLLKTYLEIKLNLNNYEFEFEYRNGEKQAFSDALKWGKQLQSEYARDKPLLKKVYEVSKAMLVDDTKSLKQFPTVVSILNNYQKHSSTLASEINKNILLSLGFKGASGIETIINDVDKNINTLSLELEDESFMLINYEQDYIDL